MSRINIELASISNNRSSNFRGITVFILKVFYKLNHFCYIQAPSIEVYNVDVADWDKTRSVAQSIGPIDLLVNNAGVTNWTSFLEVTKDELEK